MEEKFYTILTNIGKEKIANSSVLGSKVNFTKIKAGDGNGKYYEPTEDQTKLANTVWEGNIRNIEVSKENPNWIEIEAIILSDEGGFTIREFGVFDEEDNLLAISKCAETYKPIISDGSVKELLIKMVLSVSNTENVSLKVDPTIVVAKKSDVEKVDMIVDEIKSQMKEIANKQTKLENTVSNIDLSATKVNIATINGMSAKNVQAGMQELFTLASNGKNTIAGKLGNVTGNNTHAEIANRIQTDKNTAATNLSNKGVSANGNESLASLVAKIANITVAGMGGKRFTTGSVYESSDKKTFSFLDANLHENGNSSLFQYLTISNLGFYPKYVLAYATPGSSTVLYFSFLIDNFVIDGEADRYNTAQAKQPIRNGNTVYIPLSFRFSGSSNVNFTFIAFE
ncbi:phage tail protein [Clostridium botulinum]|nr:phage tail protein [Clostridium botulinum]NFR12981.1 phage tail protein [Clostridium botulinum]NFR43566.1 phage tail protein [Clostridium botulinum]NFS49980.1 phage tail protein [Clostridium botulinum]